MSVCYWGRFPAIHGFESAVAGNDPPDQEWLPRSQGRLPENGGQAGMGERFARSDGQHPSNHGKRQHAPGALREAERRNRTAENGTPGVEAASRGDAIFDGLEHGADKLKT